MKKFLFLIPILLTVKAYCFNPQDWNYIPNSSYTEVDSGGAKMISSGTIQFIGITVSSPALGSYVAIFRSTGPTFTADIATQTMLTTDYASQQVFIPMFEMQNDSYTYVSKFGAAKITYWIRCPKRGVGTGANYGVCPGLTWSGQGGK